jgi:hypothetical protein
MPKIALVGGSRSFSRLKAERPAMLLEGSEERDWRGLPPLCDRMLRRATDNLEFRLFSTIMTLGTPRDVTLQELRSTHSSPPMKPLRKRGAASLSIERMSVRQRRCAIDTTMAP